jgi:Zn-dependent peptidase ImmA (M78 family)/transcriptional regulator with XRE-family HTH domain
MKKPEFVGARLRLARRFHGLSQTEVATRVATSSAYLSQLEACEKSPGDLLVQALADVLMFDVPFFYQPLPDEFADAECNFRRRKTTAVALRRRVLAHGTLLYLVLEYLESVLTFPTPNVPRVTASSIQEIEQAAERCRVHWGLGKDLPLTHIIRVLENAGVIVTKIWANTEKVDAFSRPGRRGIVVLTEDKGSPSRSIFDASHELGHLVMHVGLPADRPELEPEADRFASAFLLPRRQFERQFRLRSQRLDWAHVFELKRQWRCSAAAIVRRAFDLSLINAAQYRQAHKYLRMKGWHKGEPAEPQPERPELLDTAFESLAIATREKPFDVARRLYLRPEVMEQVTGLPVEEPTPAPQAGIASLDEYRRRRS